MARTVRGGRNGSYFTCDACRQVTSTRLTTEATRLGGRRVVVLVIYAAVIGFVVWLVVVSIATSSASARLTGIA